MANSQNKTEESKLLDSSTNPGDKKKDSGSPKKSGSQKDKTKGANNNDDGKNADQNASGTGGNPTNGLRRIFSLLHLRHFWKSVQESWLNLPHAARLFANALLIFITLLMLFAVQLGLTGELELEAESIKHHPKWIQLMSNVLQEYIQEQKATALFMRQQSDYNFQQLKVRRSITDEAVVEVRKFSLDHEEKLETCDNLAITTTALVVSETNAIPLTTVNPCTAKPTYESEIGINNLQHIRRNVRRNVILVAEPEMVHQYEMLESRIAQHMTRAAVALGHKRGSTLQFQHTIVSRVALYYKESQVAARAIVDPNFVNDNTAAQQAEKMLTFLTKISKAQYLMDSILKPSLPEAVLNDMEILLLSSKTVDLLDTLVVDVKSKLTLDPTYVMKQTGTPNNTAAVESLHAMVSSYVSTIDTDSTTDFMTLFLEIRSAVLLVVCCIVIFVYACQYGYNHIAYAERNKIILRNAHVMHDVLVRVSEFSDAFSSVTLAPGLAPRMMMGTHSGVLEMKLQRCLASLRVVIPTMSPLMFPQLMRSKAKQQTETKGAIRDTHKLVAENDERRKRMRLDLLSYEAATQVSQDILDMQELTSNKIDVLHAAFLTVDLSELHKINTTEKLNLAEEAYPKVVTLIETCVYQFEGILYSVYGDRAIACWGIDIQTGSCEEQAATCALALASRLNGVRKLNKSLRDAFPTHLGVTAGTVRKCIFGNDETKILQIHGPPVVRGINVARTNLHHLTSVACDDNIQKKISYQCKPIELIENNERVHEIIHDASARKEIDLDSRLALYKKAFELYERNYYREALRVFRSYTKQYGYDCSVERIQSIITGV